MKDNESIEVNDSRANNSSGRWKIIGLCCLLVLTGSLCCALLLSPIRIDVKTDVNGAEASSNQVHSGDKLNFFASSKYWNSFVCKYNWNFVDGDSKSGSSVQHTISSDNANVNTVQVKCTNPMGRTLSNTEVFQWYPIIEKNNSVAITSDDTAFCTAGSPIILSSKLNELNIGDILYSTACDGFIGQIQSLRMNVSDSDVLDIQYINASFAQVYEVYSQPVLNVAFPSIADNTSVAANDGGVEVRTKELGANGLGSNDYTVEWTGGSVSLFNDETSSIVVNFEDFKWNVSTSSPNLIYVDGDLQEASVVVDTTVAVTFDIVWTVSASVSTEKTLKKWNTLTVIIPEPPTVWSADLELGIKCSAGASIEATWTANLVLSYSWEIIWSSADGFSGKVLSQNIDGTQFQSTAFKYQGEFNTEVYLDLSVNIDKFATFGDEQVFALVISSSPPFASPLLSMHSDPQSCDTNTSTSIGYWQWSNNVFADFRVWKWELLKFVEQLWLGDKHYITLPSTNNGSSSQNQYCATIDPAYSSGATGYVSMQICNGYAIYDLHLDLTDFPSDIYGCDYSQGLNYHIHSYWFDNNANSSWGSDCGASITGGHYDPYYACSVYSQSYSTYCAEIGRTTDNGYYYNCNYNENKNSCEVGDISGKNGILMPSDGGVVFTLSFPFVDYLPPIVMDYNSDGKSLPWTSVVFHCPATNSRLLCAKFVPRSLSCSQSTLDLVMATQ